VIVVWTDTALEHLAGIKRYISQTSPLYAELVVRRIFGRGKQLEAFPESGRMVPKLGRPEVREVIEAPYRVIYRLTEDHVEVVAVVHARRADIGPTP
jgi:plasmid stabilization system protein ParE